MEQNYSNNPINAPLHGQHPNAGEEPPRKKLKLAPSPHENTTHAIADLTQFRELQDRFQEAHAAIVGEQRSYPAQFLPAREKVAEDEEEVDVLGADGNEDAHFVLSAQWLAETPERPPRKKKRVSLLFTERREPHAVMSPNNSGRHAAVGRPRNDVEDRERTKNMPQALGLGHARVHSAKRNRSQVLDSESDSSDFDGAASMELNEVEGTMNVTSHKEEENEADETNIMDEAFAQPSSAPVTPSIAIPRTVRVKLVMGSSKSSKKAKKAKKSAVKAEDKTPRRSGRLNPELVCPDARPIDFSDAISLIDSLGHSKQPPQTPHRTARTAPVTPAGFGSPQPGKKLTPKTAPIRRSRPLAKPGSRNYNHGIESIDQIAAFYASLQPTHYTQKAPQPKAMVPVLFSYQLRAVSWMMERETSLWRNDGIRGGILADEMGLGKTMEMVGLVLSNPRSRFLRPLPGETPIVAPGMPDPASSMDMEPSPSGLFSTEPDPNLKPLHLTAKFVNDGWIDPPLPKEGLFDGHATLIVCPEILCQQWRDEMQRHSPQLRVHTYRGVPALTGLERALDLQGSNIFADFDVVLCSYETLAKEFPYASKPNVTTRYATEQPSTPLTKVRWWRVVMDEAQMFSQGASNAGKLLQYIKTIHRWAVSGTPVRKAFSDFRGLLLFLGAEDQYSKPTHDFLAFLKQIAWRHQMNQVHDEIIIPPSETHFLDMHLSPLEAFGAMRLAQKLKIAPDTSSPPPATLATTQPDAANPSSSSGQPPASETPSTILSDVVYTDSLSLQTGKYSSCPYQFLLERYLEQKSLLPHSDRQLLVRGLSSSISSELYSSQLAVCQALNSVGDAILAKAKLLLSASRHLPAPQCEPLKAESAQSLANAISYYRKALDLVTYQKDSAIYAQTAQLRTDFLILSPPSAPFSAVCYHTLINLIEALEVQGNEEEVEALKRKAESVRGRALQTQLNLVANAKFKFTNAKQETSRLIRNRLNAPRGEWWMSALKWVGENVPEFCELLRRGVKQQLDFMYHTLRTQVLQLNVATVDDVIDKLDLDLTRMNRQRSEAIKLAKSAVPMHGKDLDAFVTTLDQCDEALYAYSQLLIRDMEIDTVTRMVEAKVLNIAERLLLYLEAVITQRYNPLVDEQRFHPENWTPEQDTLQHKLARWLLAAEASFRELEIMKIEVTAAQAYNQAKRDYAASLGLLEDSAVAKYQDYEDFEDVQHDSQAKKVQPDPSSMEITEEDDTVSGPILPSSQNEEELQSEVLAKLEHRRAALDVEIETLSAKSAKTISSAVTLKHQLEFVLETGYQKVPRNLSFGTKLSHVAETLQQVLRDDEAQLADATLLKNKALVFSKWSEPLIQLSVFLREMNIPFRFGADIGLEGRIKGNLVERLAAFRDDPDVRVLLLNARSQSTGLTLTQANHVFLLEDIEKAQEDQAIGRAHRIGQTRVTHIWKCRVANGEIPPFDYAE